MKKDLILLGKCREAWNRLAVFRQRRTRYKNFAYGRQWCDTHRLADGRIVSDHQYLLESGRMPMTNNLIRQLLKSIVGRYRYLSALPLEDATSATGVADAADGMAGIFGDASPRRDILDIDARTLEEFLISGCAVQRVAQVGEQQPSAVVNVSPERLFFSRFQDPTGADCRMIGMLHDMTLCEVLRRFSSGEPRCAIDLVKCAKRVHHVGSGILTDDVDVDFGYTDSEETLRVVEVWQRTLQAQLRLHDPESGEYYASPLTDENVCRIEDTNRRRGSHRAREVMAGVMASEVWQQTWMLADGTVLQSTLHPEGTQPAIVVMFYPMIDGEVHSLVEDLVGQQKYVNRLITLLDDVLSNSSKGTLLYPLEQLPEGMTWSDLRRLWSSPGSVLPFKSSESCAMPQQVSSPGTHEGASQMLKMQLELFHEISGNSEALRGNIGSAKGADMLRQQAHQTNLSLLDLLATFHGFTRRRDRLLK